MRYLKGFVVTAFAICFLAQCKQSRQSNHLSENARMDGVQYAMQQEFRMTRDPQLNYIPNERLAIAKEYMQNLISSRGIQALAWTERGPNNIGGRTRAILVDKRDATGNTVFAASVSGGLFKTTNFTSASPAWAAVNDFLPNLAICALVQDNTNQNIMYAGTGEGWGNIDAVRGRGIYKSTDGGTSWNVLPSTIQTTPQDSVYEFVQDLAIDNNGAVYASLRNQIGNSRGVKRSVDGGTTWNQVLGLPLPNFTTGRATDLEVAGNGDVYACLGIFGRGSIWKSSFATHGVNTGALGNWVEVTPPWIRPRFRVELAVAPSNPQRLYAVGQDSATDQVIGLWRSFNGGANWDSVGSPSEFNNGSFSQTWFNMIMAVDPNNADILVAGGLDIAKSTNAGVNWTNISGGVHVDHHVLHYVTSARLINGNDGGLYYSPNADQGSPGFSNKNNGYNVTQYYACDVHPTNANYFLAGAQDNGTHKFTTAGINTVVNVVGGDGGFCHIRNTDGQLQIAATTRNTYFRSTNGGANFASLGSGINNSRGQFINPTDLDDNSFTLYCGDDPGKYYIVTGLNGTPSSLIATVPNMQTRELTAVKVDPFSANTIWVGASYNLVPMVLKISNANAVSPTVVTATTISVSAGAAISSIDVDPANGNHILVTLSNYGIVSVWESTNGGGSFTPIEGNLPDMPIRWGLFAPATAELNGTGNGLGGILLGTELGVWTTSQINGSSTQWIPNNSGLANVRTDMLKWRPSDNTVAAATHGRGLFTTIIPTVATGVSNIGNTKNFIKYSFVENMNLNIVIGNLQTKTITVQLTDMKGSLVHNSHGRYQNTTINLQKLQTGSYILKVTGNNKESFIKHFVR